MSGVKSIRNCAVVISVAVFLFLVFGCGGSVEKDKMTAFLQECQKNLDTYEEAIGQSDEAKKATIKAKLEASMAEWKALRDNAVENVTPQVIEKFEREFQAVKKKYVALNGQS